MLPHDLFQGNRQLLAQSWRYPERATEYDLTAPLNEASFAHDYTFQSVIAECRFEGGQLARIELRAIEEGYGSPLTQSGIPRVVTDAAAAAAIYRQVSDRTAAFGLPALKLSQDGATATVRP